MAPTIPTLRDEATVLRPIRVRDARALERELLESRAWLRPWEATSPSAPMNWDTRGSIRSLLAGARAGTGLPFIIETEGRLAGQLNVSGMSYGALASASIGYWVGAGFAGRGLTPTAVALATDYVFFTTGLHRMEICIRPEKPAQCRIAGPGIVRQRLGLVENLVRLQLAARGGTAHRFGHGDSSLWVAACRPRGSRASPTLRRIGDSLSRRAVAGCAKARPEAQPSRSRRMMQRRPRFGPVMYFTLAGTFGIYLVFAAVQGEYGLFNRIQIEADAALLRADRDRLAEELAEIENRTHRLSDAYLDLDLLDEQARDILGLIRPDEILLR